MVRKFSVLCQITNLRGGNLLFHTKNLKESGMVLQSHERGDYIITGKGQKMISNVRAASTSEPGLPFSQVEKVLLKMVVSIVRFEIQKE
jgi:hypothetical protein